MHLKVVIFCGVLFCVGHSVPPRKYDDSGNFVIVSNSNDGYKTEDKNHRSGYYGYPLILPHHKPPVDFYGYGAPQNPPQSSLLTANVQLLEPFMLVTFLVFVLSLIERAKLPSLLSVKRNDNLTYGNSEAYNPYLKMMPKQNETEF